MMNILDSAATLSDSELLVHLKAVAANERQATAHLIASLAEVDAKRLYLGEGYSSLFIYCTRVLHLSEHAAYGRIAAARAARKFPVILDALASGSVHLTAICIVAPHLTEGNVERVLAAATHRTKRDVEELVAALRPQPPVVSAVRKLPSPKPDLPTAPSSAARADLLGIEPVAASTSAIPSPTDTSLRLPPAPAQNQRMPLAEVKPLSPERYKVQFTASREMHDKLREAQALLRHQIPNGDVAEIFDRALTLLVTELRRTRHAGTGRPRARRQVSATGRYVPAAIKRDVWARDGGQCAFVGAAGRCTEPGFLEYHHVVPFVDGGKATVANLELRCRAHNAYERDRWFGTVGDIVRESMPLYRSTNSLFAD